MTRLPSLIIATSLVTAIAGCRPPGPGRTVPGLRVSEVTINSSVDGSLQPIIVGVPEGLGSGSVPLLVGLHTWSGDYQQQLETMGPLAVQYHWLLVLPHFRGPSLSSNHHVREAGGSPLAQADVLDAVSLMQREYAVDGDRVYLLGESGGGHMALLLAGTHPEMWGGISAWCPITDLREWYAQANSYGPHLEAVCGGAPGASPAVDFEYLRRSPRTYMTNAARTPIQICHGREDQTVWVSQTQTTVKKLSGLTHRAQVRLFNGGHEANLAEGAAWLSLQRRERVAPSRQVIATDEARWYYWLFVKPADRASIARCEASCHPLRSNVPDVRGAAYVLSISTRQSSLVQIRLSGLHAKKVISVSCPGRHLAPGEWAQDGDLLRLRPASPAQTSYKVLLR